MSDASKKRTCFVIGPIGDMDSETRVHADWLLEEIIVPAMTDFQDFEVVRADKIAQPGMIDAQVIRNLLDAELVIADLSQLNPNAFYELGIRHMAQKPIIHMQLAEDVIPFDVSLYRATKFSRKRPTDLRKARDDLRSAIRAVLDKDYVVDNPVTRARGQIKIEQTATPEQRVILQEIRSLVQRVDGLERFTFEKSSARTAQEPFDLDITIVGAKSSANYVNRLENFVVKKAMQQRYRVRSYNKEPNGMKLTIEIPDGTTPSDLSHFLAEIRRFDDVAEAEITAIRHH